MNKCLLFLILILFSGNLHAAKIGEVTQTHWIDQVRSFVVLQGISIRIALIGAILLGISCGLLGSFMVVRRKALMGDTIAHAVLPGIVIGFLWTMEKNPLYMFIGAVISGFLGTYVINRIKRATILKEDSSMGLVLTGFYAVGICLITMVQNIPTGHQAGLDKYLFGQAAALAWSDIWLMSGVTILSLLLITVFYKEFLVTSFDDGFARSIGVTRFFFNEILMLLVAFTMVISIKAVGVILVSAMLIMPAATAIMLTNRMHVMITIAIGIGILSAVMGTFLSFIAHNLPTGPFMVVFGAVVFALVFFFSPTNGLITQWWWRRVKKGPARKIN